MTPDTLKYMIAGYIVIGVGSIAYVISILIRSANVKLKWDQKQKNKND